MNKTVKENTGRNHVLCQRIIKLAEKIKKICRGESVEDEIEQRRRLSWK